MNKKLLHPSIPLKRALNQFLVISYGLGTILGAGIYVLIAKVSAHAGVFMPFSFLLAAVIALFTAISYAELSSRYPKSAGEAYYVREAFRTPVLSALIGWLVAFTGIATAAVLCHGFAAYFGLFVNLPLWLIFLGFVLLITSIAIWGISQSAVIIMLITLVEVAGLLFIIFLGVDKLDTLPSLWQMASDKPALWWGTITGALIAFYAFIGLEDMVNIAEEVKEPESTLPSSILWTLTLSTVLYFLVACAFLAVLPIDKLAQSNAPFAYFVQSKGYSSTLISLIGMIAIANGAIAQVIMSSRIIYGMAKQNNAPGIFSSVSPSTKTPAMASLMVLLLVILFALFFDIETLAQMASAVILFVFIFIHASLLFLKSAAKQRLKKETRVYSIMFPIIGLILSVVFLTLQIYSYF